MNKKNLSVVMAGAMLATSVVPVLAATETTVPSDQLSLLKNNISAKMDTAKTSKHEAFAQASGASKLLSKDAAEDAYNKYESLYGVKVLKKDGKTVKVDLTFKKSEVEAAITNAKEGETIEVHKITNASTLYGQTVVATLPKVDDKAVVERYEKVDADSGSWTALKTALEKSAFIKTATPNKDDDENKLDITYETLEDINDKESNKTETITVGDQKLDITLPLDKDGNLLSVKADGTAETDTEVQKFDHFEKLYTWKQGEQIDPTTTVEETIKVGAPTSASEDENLTIADLYDGYVLTAKGTALAADIKNAADKAGSTPDNKLVKISSSVTEETRGSGVFMFTVKYYSNVTDASHSGGTGQNEYKTVTVRSTNKTELENLRALIAGGKYKVGVIGGDNRYETAVNVSKEQGISEFANKAGQNIILVNGESLVDGLSAAPLAAKLGCYDASNQGKKVSAPVLLTSSDSLSKATEEYLTELTKNIAPSSLDDNVTINLVGGKSVLSSSLEKELKDKGFKVVRYGGDDREETSLKVADAIGGTSAFVVGGNGEADAMSIAAVAADETTQTPIIVSSVHGLSEEAVNYIDSKITSNVTVIGGEAVVSKAEEAKINEVLDSSVVRRIAGDNRFETNAKIISAFYDDNAKGAVVVKDGQSNKSELVDALSAANYAASIDAPIVLASNTLKDSQSTALLNLNMSSKEKVMQVGQGAARDLLEKVAKLLDVSNL